MTFWEFLRYYILADIVTTLSLVMIGLMFMGLSKVLDKDDG